jgi:hypothetical protein
MLAEDLKTRVDKLSDEQRHELSVYLTMIQLERDADYWKTIRERSANLDPARWVSIDEIRSHGA